MLGRWFLHVQPLQEAFPGARASLPPARAVNVGQAWDEAVGPGGQGSAAAGEGTGNVLVAEAAGENGDA